MFLLNFESNISVDLDEEVVNGDMPSIELNDCLSLHFP
jgi:hypothetical protein